jgi:hypothetical protein
MVGVLFPKPKPIPTNAPAPKPPGITDPLTRDEADDERTAAAEAAGRASTIMTGGQGDTSTPTLGKKTLLGG